MMKAIGCALALSLLPVCAWAWDSPDGIISAPMPESGQVIDAASDHFSRGVNFFRDGNYDAARIEFQAALDLSGRADLWHNLSMVAERQGQFDRAIECEEQFARKAGDLTEREQDEVRGRIARLKEMKAGRAAAPQRQPAATAPAAIRTDTERGANARIPYGAIGLLAGGGAALVIGIGCGGAALADQNHLYTGVYSDEYDAINSCGPKLNAAAISFFVIGGVALAGGAAWTIAHRVRRSSRAPLDIMASATGDLARVR